MKQAQRYLVIACCVALGTVGCGGAQSDAGTQPAGEESIEATALDSYNYYIEQASLALVEGNTDGALENYMAAAQVLDDTGEPTQKSADAHFEAAKLAYQKYDKELAISEYQKAIDLYLRFPGNAQSKAAVSYTNMGVVYKEMHDKARARTCWQQALDIYKNAGAEAQNAAHVEKIEQNIRDLDEGF